jgi:hypothetical protein
MIVEEEKKRGRGRPPLTDEQKRENALARKRGELAPGKKNFGEENVQAGDNSRYLRHALATLELPPIDISNAAQVSDRLGWYFNHCADSDMKPTVNGMCNALGIHRDTLHAWRTGEYRADSHQAIVMKAYRVLEELWEDYMLNGKINPVSGIFLSKNLFYGYADKQEFVLTPNSGLSEEDAATIAAKYDELPE